MKWILMILLVVSCGEDNNYDNDPIIAEETAADDLTFNTFSTRLTNSLLVKGERCDGTQSADFRGQIFTCLNNQWLISIDDVNVCSPEGCTDIIVQPTIGGLRSTGNTTGATDFFLIEPLIPLTEQHEQTLNRLLLRVDERGIGTVVFR